MTMCPTCQKVQVTQVLLRKTYVGCKTPTLLDKWTVDDVVTWAIKVLTDVNLPTTPFADKLKDQFINGPLLLDMTDEKLERCGIPIGHATALGNAIDILRATFSSWHKPIPLVETRGAKWSYQHGDQIKKILAANLPSHFDAC